MTMREYDRDTLIDVLQHKPKEEIILWLAELVDSSYAGAPYRADDWAEAASCCSCCADTPPELMPYVNADDEEEDVSVMVWIDDPDNHDDNCAYRVCREILRDLGFYYEPKQVRNAIPKE